MTYRWRYETPDGFDDMLMSSDGRVLTGLRFAGFRDASGRTSDCEERDLPVFRETRRWLDVYFSGGQPDFIPPYSSENLTPFRREVRDIMLAVPFGKTTTYGEIAGVLAKKRGIAKMSAQAVGGAVGWNPLCIIVPCHRVVGVNAGLTGYGGGIENKIALLAHEGNDVTKYMVPKMEQL